MRSLILTGREYVAQTAIRLEVDQYMRHVVVLSLYIYAITIACMIRFIISVAGRNSIQSFSFPNS